MVEQLDAQCGEGRVGAVTPPLARYGEGERHVHCGADASAHTQLGRIGLLVTPVNANGQPARGWTVHGYKVAWSWISTWWPFRGAAGRWPICADARLSGCAGAAADLWIGHRRVGGVPPAQDRLVGTVGDEGTQRGLDRR